MKIKKVLVALAVCVTTLSMTACEFRVGNTEYTTQVEDEKNTKDEKEEGTYTSSNSVVKGYFEALQSGKQSKIKECFPKDSDSYSETTADMDTIKLDIDNIQIESISLDIDELDEDAVKALGIESAKQVTAVVPMTQTIDGVEYQVEETYDIITCCINDYWYIYQLDSKGAIVVGQDNSTDDSSNKVSEDELTEALEALDSFELSASTSSSSTGAIDVLDEEFDTLTYSEASEMISAIESFYNSTIIDIEDNSYSDSESADFTLANGKSCRYFASNSDSKSVYDTSDTYETIWSVYR